MGEIMSNRELARITANRLHHNRQSDLNEGIILTALNEAAKDSFQRRLLGTMKYAHTIKKLGEALHQIGERLEFVDPNVNPEASRQNVVESLEIAQTAVTKYVIEEIAEAVADKRPLLLYVVREDGEVAQVPEAKESDYADLLAQITDLQNEIESLATESRPTKETKI